MKLKKKIFFAALETIVGADSSLHEYWESYLAKEYESGENLNNQDQFNDMNAIANYLIEKRRSGQAECF